MNIILPSNAPMAANLNLAAQLLMGSALIVGMFLARRKLFRAHAICQSLVVLLNLIPIAIYMLPVFRRGVLPTLPGTLGEQFYAVSTIHAALGLVAEVFGLYIILNAGTRLLPQALRFENYKRWMRAELALWWLVIALGVGTYWVWYQAGAASSPAAGSNAAQNAAQNAAVKPLTATITLGNFQFEPKDLTVEPGTVVVWKDVAGPHTVKADDGSFESPILSAGQEFSRKFETEGRYPYYCTLHGSEGGHDMAGVIVVARRPRP